ncbi:MAG: hypothetical protein OXR62_06960 [Ahrensia sp.]|nr:hypothetical protein [Ahrensia sp.]
MTKAVLDENLAVLLARTLSDDELVVEPIPIGWRGLTNGRLISCIEASHFSVFVSADRKLPHEQNISDSGIAFVIVSTNHLPTLVGQADQIRKLIKSAEAGRFAVMERDGTCFFVSVEQGKRTQKPIHL